MTTLQLDDACIIVEDFVRACLRMDTRRLAAAVEIDGLGAVLIEDRERFAQLVAGLVDDLRRAGRCYD